MPDLPTFDDAAAYFLSPYESVCLLDEEVQRAAAAFLAGASRPGATETLFRCIESDRGEAVAVACKALEGGPIPVERAVRWLGMKCGGSDGLHNQRVWLAISVLLKEKKENVLVREYAKVDQINQLTIENGIVSRVDADGRRRAGAAFLAGGFPKVAKRLIDSKEFELTEDLARQVDAFIDRLASDPEKREWSAWWAGALCRHMSASIGGYAAPRLAALNQQGFVPSSLINDLIKSPHGVTLFEAVGRESDAERRGALEKALVNAVASISEGASAPMLADLVAAGSTPALVEAAVKRLVRIVPANAALLAERFPKIESAERRAWILTGLSTALCFEKNVFALGLKDSDAAVRSAAAEGILRLGWELDAQAPALRAALAGPDADKNYADWVGRGLDHLERDSKTGVARLLEFGPAAVNAISDTSIRGPVEKQYESNLCRAISNGVVDLETLLKLAADPREAIAGAAIENLPRKDATEAETEGILKIFEASKATKCKEKLLYVVGDMSLERAIPIIERALKDKDAPVRLEAFNKWTRFFHRTPPDKATLKKMEEVMGREKDDRTKTVMGNYFRMMPKTKEP